MGLMFQPFGLRNPRGVEAMSIISIEEAGHHVGETVTIRGWLRSRRDSGKLHFLTLRDGSGDIQAVVSKKVVGEEQFAASAKLTQESSLIITGQLRADSRAPGGYEVDVAQLQAVQVADPFPIQPKEHGVGFLMEHRHLWLRSARQHAILRIRHEIIRASRDFFDDRGFVLVDAPIFTPNACEGTTTLFQTPYFDETADLTQTGQLYSEATAAAFGKVSCFGPTFRAEKSKTRRHLMEFWMVEPEVAFAELADMMDLAELFLSTIVQRVLETKRHELGILGRDIAKLERVVAPFPRLTYEEAVGILQKTKRQSFQANSIVPLSCIVIRWHSRRFTCNPILSAPIWPCAWMCWHRRDTAKSSAGDNVFTTTTCCVRVFANISYRKKRSVGTWISAVSGPFHTQDSGWESKELSRGFAGSNTFAKRFRSHGCSISCTPRLGETLLKVLRSPLYEHNL